MMFLTNIKMYFINNNNNSNNNNFAFYRLCVIILKKKKKDLNIKIMIIVLQNYFIIFTYLLFI